MIFDGYIKIRESLYTWVIFWINIILEHVETRVIIPRFEDSCMVYRPKWCQKKKNPSNTHTLLVSKKKLPKWYEKTQYHTNIGIN